MAHYIFVVNVRTDDNSPNAPSADTLRFEIRSNLEWEAYAFGVNRVTVRQVHSNGGMTEAMREATSDDEALKA